MFSLAFQDKRIWQACKNQKRSEGIGASQVLSLCCKLGWKKKGAPDLCLSNQGNLLFPCTIGIPCSATGNHHLHSGPHWILIIKILSSNNVTMCHEEWKIKIIFSLKEWAKRTSEWKYYLYFELRVAHWHYFIG